MAAHRVKVDEDLPLEVAEVFRDAGYNALTVHEQRLTGSPDARLWSRVQHEGRLLVTADKGFADLRDHPPDQHAGLLLFRLERESRAGYVQLARRLLSQHDLARMRGAVTVVTFAGIRIHQP